MQIVQCLELAIVGTPKLEVRETVAISEDKLIPAAKGAHENEAGIMGT